MARFPRRLFSWGLALPIALLGCSSAQKHCDTCSSCDACTSNTVVATPAPVIPGTPPAGTKVSALPPAAPPDEVTLSPAPSTERGYDPTARPAPVTNPRADAGPTTSYKHSFDTGTPGIYHHSADYSTLVGELNRDARTGEWRLRYAGVDQDDKFGGSVSLKGITRDMSNVRSGQWAKVQGTVVDSESRERSPGFRVREIEPLGPTR